MSAKPLMKVTWRPTLVVVALALGCQGAPPEAAEGGSSEAATQAVMRLELASLSGDLVNPSEVADLVLIDFWATWCAPCHVQADILAKLYPELSERGVEFLAISLGEPESVVSDFVAKKPFAYPVLIDPDDYVLETYGIYVLPTVVVLNREGSVLYKHEGISTEGRLRTAFEEIFADERPTARL